MQKQFVADASHELKTPLTVITANAELLQERYAGISAEADKWMEHVNQEVQGNARLVEVSCFWPGRFLCTGEGRIYPVQLKRAGYGEDTDL